MTDTISSESQPTMKPKTRLAWKCTVCGHIETRYPEGLPADYRCPICGAKPKKFVQVEIEV